MEVLPRGQPVYETSAIPRVTSGLPHGAVLDAWLDSVTKQPHASMQQSIAVAGVEERYVCGTRQPKAFGPVTALPGASNILPACVRSAVTVIQPVTSLPTSLQLPEHDGIAVAKEQPSASETAQPTVCWDQSGTHVDAATLELLSNWAGRPKTSACVTRGTVDAATPHLLSYWAQCPEPSPCVTRGTVDAAAPDLLSYLAQCPEPSPCVTRGTVDAPPLICCQIGPSVASLRPVLHVVLWTRPPLICCQVGPSVPYRLPPVVSCQ